MVTTTGNSFPSTSDVLGRDDSENLDTPGSPSSGKSGATSDATSGGYEGASSNDLSGGSRDWEGHDPVSPDGNARQSMDGAGQKLREQGEHLREMSDEWTQSLRSTVREHPVAAVATALAIGVLLARLSA